MQAVVVHHRAVDAEPVPAARLGDRAVAGEADVVAGGNRLAAQIHFQKRHAGIVLQHNFTRRAVGPQHIARQLELVIDRQVQSRELR